MRVRQRFLLLVSISIQCQKFGFYIWVCLKILQTNKLSLDVIFSKLGWTFLPFGRSSVVSLHARTCNEEFSSARGLSSTVGCSDRKSSAVCGGHSGDPQNSAAVAERDLNAGKSGSGKNLAITEPAHLRNWRTCREEKIQTGLLPEQQTHSSLLFSSYT